MANRDTPNGFTPAFHLMGGVIRPQKYTIASGQTNSIFSGDMVKQTSTAKGVQVVGATGDNMLGAFAGVSWRDTNGEYRYSTMWTTATATLGTEAATAWVYDDPNIIYEVQCDGTLSATDIGVESDLVLTAGNSSFGRSRQELDATVSADAQLFIYDVVDRVGNDIASANANFYVMINLHPYVNIGASRVVPS